MFMDYLYHKITQQTIQKKQFSTKNFKTKNPPTASLCLKRAIRGPI